MTKVMPNISWTIQNTRWKIQATKEWNNNVTLILQTKLESWRNRFEVDMQAKTEGHRMSIQRKWQETQREIY